MQSSKYQPRLQSSDLELYQRVLTSKKISRDETLEDEQNSQPKSPLTNYSFGYSDAQNIGRFSYILGYPLTEVRSYFLEAAHYVLKLLEWTNIHGPSLLTITTDDGRGNVSTKIRKDYSLTNSYKCLQGMYLALIGGDIDLAKSIASMTLDPPKSRDATPNQRHLAYAVKNLLLGFPDQCLQELSLIDINITNRRISIYRKREEAEFNCQREMVQAIVSQQPDVFENSLKELVDWYEKTAPKMILGTPKKRRDPDYPDYFMSISGLGLFVLARNQGLIKEINLSSVYLPLELVNIN